jgi:hypothetical protein
MGTMVNTYFRMATRRFICFDVIQGLKKDRMIKLKEGKFKVFRLGIQWPKVFEVKIASSSIRYV